MEKIFIKCYVAGKKAGYRAGLSVMFSATKGAERYNIK